MTFPKSISMTMFIIIGCGLSLFFVMGPIFHIPMKGSLALFSFVTSLYTFASTLIGIDFRFPLPEKWAAQAGAVMRDGVDDHLFPVGQFTPPEAMPKPLFFIMHSLLKQFITSISHWVSSC